MEHVISDECLASIRRTCYKSGAAGREVYTSRGPDGPEVVRCRDCDMYDHEEEKCFRDPDHTGRGWSSSKDGFCSWGKRAWREKE